jgi:hypothetical protein
MPAKAVTNSLPRHFRISLTLALTLAALTTFSAAQTATTLHTFTSGTDGGNPQANLAADANGNLFGTTTYGGDLSCGGGVGCGVIFEEAAPATSSGSWTYSVLYSFTGGVDGCCQLSTLAIDHASNLYGVTNNGAPGGSIFRLSPPAVQGDPWKFDLLHKFNDPTTSGTNTPLTIDKKGDIYAASVYGGYAGCSYSDGCGSVAQFVPPATIGGAWSENVLYQFQGGADGGNPLSALVSGTNGVLYGAALVGGLVTSHCPLGCGVIYQLTPPVTSGGTWTESVIYTFQDLPDGATPYSLTSDKFGALYGLACCHGAANAFQMYKLIPPVKGQTAWTKAFIHGFTNTFNAPNNVVVGSNGVLYGAAFGEIDFSVGYAYQLVPPATKGGLWTFTTFVNLGDSRNPNGVIQGAFGALYGTQNGGDSDSGLVFELQP